MIARCIENIYQFQIAKIAEIKRRKCDFESNSMLRSEDIFSSKKKFVFNDIDNTDAISWDFCTFKVKETENEDVPVIGNII